MNFNTNFKLSNNKFVEIEVDKNEINNFSFLISYTTKGDHAGLKLRLSFFSHDISLAIIDSRHWNYECDRWMTPEEQKDDEAISDDEQ